MQKSATLLLLLGALSGVSYAETDVSSTDELNTSRHALVNQGENEDGETIYHLQASIAGVNLGMPQSEAITALSTYLAVPSSDLITDNFRATSPITQATYTRYVKVRTETGDYSVYFSPTKIDGTEQEAIVVSRVIYRMEWSRENAENLRQAAQSLYGPATQVDGDATTYWCTDPKQESCTTNTFPRLRYSNTTLELVDPGYAIALKELGRPNVAPIF
uniref:hypothetical protein n=1 Tax=Thaumasiovibrio occultus TaxID=1891184 RepID=UPI000B35B555|nr:hypothetical protein [Thaumasiovibrio occultus]